MGNRNICENLDKDGCIENGIKCIKNGKVGEAFIFFKEGQEKCLQSHPLEHCWDLVKILSCLLRFERKLELMSKRINYSKLRKETLDIYGVFFFNLLKDLYPNDPRSLSVQVEFLFQAKKVEKANEVFDTLIGKDREENFPNIDVLYYRRGCVKAEMGHYDEALQDFTQALKRFDSEVGTIQKKMNYFRYRSKIHFFQKKYNDSLEDLKSGYDIFYRTESEKIPNVKECFEKQMNALLESVSADMSFFYKGKGMWEVRDSEGKQIYFGEIKFDFENQSHHKEGIGKSFLVVNSVICGVWKNNELIQNIQEAIYDESVEIVSSCGFSDFKILGIMFQKGFDSRNYKDMNCSDIMDIIGHAFLIGTKCITNFIKLIKQRNNSFLTKEASRLDEFLHRYRTQRNHELSISTSFADNDCNLGFNVKIGLNGNILESRFGDLDYKNTNYRPFVLSDRRIELLDFQFEILTVDINRDDNLRDFLYSQPVIEQKKKWDRLKLLKFNEKEHLEFVLNLSRMVHEFFIGDIDMDSITSETAKNNSMEIRNCRKDNVNVLLIGDMKGKYGGCKHFSVMFKCVCDAIGVRCKICTIRGFHSWNVILLPNKALYFDLLNYRNEPMEYEDFFREYRCNWPSETKNYFRDRELEERDSQLFKDKVYVKLLKSRRNLRKSINKVRIIRLEEDVHDDKGNIHFKKDEIFSVQETPIRNEEIRQECLFKVELMKNLIHENLVYCDGYFQFDGENEESEGENIEDDHLPIFCTLLPFRNFNGLTFLENVLKSNVLNVIEKEVETTLLLFGIANGLNFLYRCGFVHLSLSLSNVLVEYNHELRMVQDVRVACFDTIRDDVIDSTNENRSKSFKESDDIYCFGRIMESMKASFSHRHDMIKLMNKLLSVPLQEETFRREYFMSEILRALSENISLLQKKFLDKGEIELRKIFYILSNK